MKASSQSGQCSLGVSLLLSTLCHHCQQQQFIIPSMVDGCLSCQQFLSYYSILMPMLLPSSAPFSPPIIMYYTRNSKSFSFMCNSLYVSVIPCSAMVVGGGVV
eukprot:scaffold1836_cov90-Skeletonema_dohrnii-CCMP3373.AAC.2